MILSQSSGYVINIKKQVKLILFVFLFFSFTDNCLSITLKTEVNADPGKNNSDSVTNHGSVKIIKINPGQVFFSEIPVSFEYFYKQRSSIQFQLGYIFPLNEELPPILLFESMGQNGDATSEGLFSYMTSPYNNYGLSFRIELREYKRYLYYAPQFIYKYCFYKEAAFPIYSNRITVDQTESKFSNIFGLGFIIGRQFEAGKMVFDGYSGVGLRVRSISVTILKIVDPPRPDKYPNSKENFTSFYPFINFGFRIGIKL
jgi:hypothetical protein